jgi:hypothetical protein
MTAAPAGQYIVLRLRPRPDESALLRSYSLSGAPSEDRYRISIKREPHGAAGAYIDTRVQPGDVLGVGTARRSLTLQRGMVLWSFSAPASASPRAPNPVPQEFGRRFCRKDRTGPCGLVATLP